MSRSRDQHEGEGTLSQVVQAEIAATYRTFAAVEARRRSPVYADVAERVSQDTRTLQFLTALPRVKRQPNLLFAAVQYLGGPMTGWDAVAGMLTEHADDVEHVMRSRSTQTNLPARCATLLPALAQLPPPLALLEVGASAGLCLYPDRYGYAYNGDVVLPAPSPDAPTFSCTASNSTPLPDRPLEVVWRAGLDLNPLSVTDADDVAWLEALIWPGEEHLRDQLRATTGIARAEPPLLVCGDLRTDLAELLVRAPSGATLVVFHTAVLSYVDDPDGRQTFAATVASSPAVWLANEPAERVPGLNETMVRGHPEHLFLLCRDGEPLARTDPHGSSVDWLTE